MLAIQDAKPVKPTARLRAGSIRMSAYEGGAHSRRTSRWQAPTVSANAGLLGNLTTLRDRSRAAVRNNGFAKTIIEKIVSNVVGTGIKPLSQADDPAFASQAQELWARWTEESDADGLLDFYKQQAQAVRTWLEGGDAFVRLRDRQVSDGLSVPLQIQVLEPEHCPHGYTVWSADRKIRAGIEFDALGRRRFYHFHPSRPEVDDFDANTLRRVPSDHVIHLYDPLRPGQLRGVPHLTQALVKLFELDKFDDATLLRQQLANMFVAFLEQEAAQDQTGINPVTGEVIEMNADNLAMLTLEPGIFQKLNPGQKVSFSEPPDAGQAYPDFMRQQLYHISAAALLPYELMSGDMSRVNDRTVRVILHEFRRQIMAWQHQIVGHMLCQRVWRAWMDAAFFSGALPIPDAYATNPEPWARVKWMPQAWPYLHPVQDVQATTMAIQAGLTTRSDAVSELGEDAQAVDAQQATDNDRADGLGLKYTSDGRRSASNSAPPSSPTADPEDATLAPATQTGVAA